MARAYASNRRLISSSEIMSWSVSPYPRSLAESKTLWRVYLFSRAVDVVHHYDSKPVQRARLRDELARSHLAVLCGIQSLDFRHGRCPRCVGFIRPSHPLHLCST